MATESRPPPVLPVLSILLLVVACAAQPRSEYPVLEAVRASDAAADCAGLDDEILKANAIRDAIYEEHGDVVGGAVAGTAVDLAMDPVSGILSGIIGAAATSKATRKYRTAAYAAEQRIEQLLADKDSKACPSGPNADPAMTDSLVLGALRASKAQLDQKEISEREYLSGRRRLLDALR